MNTSPSLTNSEATAFGLGAFEAGGLGLGLPRTMAVVRSVHWPALRSVAVRRLRTWRKGNSSSGQDPVDESAQPPASFTWRLTLLKLWPRT